MRKLKAALSLTLALVLSLALTVPAFADPVEAPFVAKLSDAVSEGTIQGRWLMGTAEMELYTVKQGSTITLDEWGGLYRAYIDADGTYRYSSNDPENIEPMQQGYVVTFGPEHAGLWLASAGEFAMGFYLNVLADDSSASEQPTQPTTPTEPEQPTQPTTPVEPEQPSTPSEPTTPVVPADGAYKVSTSAGNGLNVRTGPGTNYKKAAPALREGTVIEIVEIQGQWGKLANDAGWVFMPGTKAVSEPVTPVTPAEPEQPTEPAVELPVTLQVSTSAGKGLNVRTGPGTNYKLASAALREGTVIEVVEINGQWGKLADDAGWVFLPGTKAVKG